MPAKPQKKKKIRDTTDYTKLDFNPLIYDQSTYDKLNEEYDPTLVDHRRRLEKWKSSNAERDKLANELNVEYKPNLTPVSEILKGLK